MSWIFSIIGNFFGAWLMKPKVEPIVCPAIRPNADDKKRKTYILIEVMEIDGIHIETGLQSDGASVPKFAWGLVGHPFSPLYVAIALCHDKLYQIARKIQRGDKLRTDALSVIAQLEAALERRGFVPQKGRAATDAAYLTKLADEWLYRQMRLHCRKLAALIFWAAVRVYSTIKF